MTISKRPAAEADLLAIWLHIASEDDIAADRLLDRIETALQLLGTHNLAGRARPDLGENIRSFVVGRYGLYYGVTTDGIELYRVLHGARDIWLSDMEP